MSNIPGVIEIRSISRFGLSVVTIVFEEDMGTYLPRQLISEKLDEVKEEIPEGMGEPFMGPITTGLGEIYQYVIVPLQGSDDEAILLTWEPSDGKVSRPGDLGFTYGIYTMALKDGSKSMQGTYVSVWVKEAGQWRFALDTGNEGL